MWRKQKDVSPPWRARFGQGTASLETLMGPWKHAR